MSAEFCPKRRCRGVLLMAPGTPETYKARCANCSRVWALDDNLNVVRWDLLKWNVAALIVVYLLAALVEIPH